jgi:hypothetical protein
MASANWRSALMTYMETVLEFQLHSSIIAGGLRRAAQGPLWSAVLKSKDQFRTASSGWTDVVL